MPEDMVRSWCVCVCMYVCICTSVGASEGCVSEVWWSCYAVMLQLYDQSVPVGYPACHHRILAVVMCCTRFGYSRLERQDRCCTSAFGAVT